MLSRRSSKDSTKSRSSRKSKEVLNEVEVVSSQSHADDSADYLRESKKIRKSSRSSKKGQKTEDDTEDYFSDLKRKKEKSSKKKNKSSVSKEDSTEDVLSDSANGDKDKSTPGRKKARKRRKSMRTSESNSRESIGDRDSSSKKDSAKGKRKKRQKQKETEKPNELPITEILKKAQQQRTKYEEPAPLPELTASTIYVQDMNGFSAIKIQSKHPRRGLKMISSSASSKRPLEVAIVFQQIWRISGFIFQGLLGGMAVLHLIFMKTYFQSSDDFISSYSQLVEIYESCFSFLIAMCLISVFDKFDIAHIGKNYFRQIFQYHLKSILAFPLYIAAFSLHQLASKVDDKLILLRYDLGNYTDYPYNDVNNTNEEIEVGELKTWRRMTFSKDILAVLGWIFISIGNREDMLLEHLEDMSKSEDNVDGPV